MKRKKLHSREIAYVLSDKDNVTELIAKFGEDLRWYFAFRGIIIGKPRHYITRAYTIEPILVVYANGYFIGRKKAMKWYDNNKFLPECEKGYTYNILD